MEKKILTTLGIQIVENISSRIYAKNKENELRPFFQAFKGTIFVKTLDLIRIVKEVWPKYAGS